MANRDRILSLARAARFAFEAGPLAHHPQHPTWFERFPRGCCGDASLMLAEVFRERGHDARVCYGDPPSGGCSHAWLAIDGLIVDVTADLFQLPSVVVSEDPPWPEPFGPSSGPQSIGAFPADEGWRAVLAEGAMELRKRVDAILAGRIGAAPSA